MILTSALNGQSSISSAYPETAESGEVMFGLCSSGRVNRLCDAAFFVANMFISLGASNLALGWGKVALAAGFALGYASLRARP